MLDPERAARFFLDVDRAELGRRIDARFDAMLASGALEEVERSPRAGSIRAAGDEGAWRAVADPPSARRDRARCEAAEGGKRDTRRYTKRQATWFRNQMPDWPWVGAAEILARTHGMGEKGLTGKVAVPYKPRKEMSIRHECTQFYYPARKGAHRRRLKPCEWRCAETGASSPFLFRESSE